MEESHIVLLKNFVSKINIEAETAYDELYRVFTHEFDMPIIFVPFKRESICFRSRNNSDGKDYCNFSNLSYPAKEYLTKYSRANKPGQQVFYCSDNYGTSLTELLPFWSKDMEVGDLITVTVSQWNFNKEFYAAAIPDFTNNRLMSLLENNLPSLKSDNVFKKYWGYINTFFRTQGFYQPNIYKFTSAFCNALMHNSRIMRENIDGILYTSLQDTSGWNLAISSKFVDENLELKRVFKILLRKQGYTNGKPVYDNFLTPEPIFPKLLDISSQKIIWE